MSHQNTSMEQIEETTNPISRRSLIAIFIALLAAVLVASLDQTILATALPTIVGELGGVNHMLWITTAYVLAATIMMLLYGKIGDLIGRKYLFISALILFGIGSLVCALVPSMEGLIVGRAVQGLGGGGLMILSQAIIADVVPPRDRAKYLGIMGVAFVVPMILGPLLGGLFTDTIGWRFCFWFNIPLAVLAIVAAVVFLPKPAKVQGRPSFDVWGALTISIALTSLILVTSWGGVEHEWNSPVIIGLIVSTVVAAVAFVLVERKVKEPLLPLSLFKNRNFNIATFAGLVSMLALMGAITYLPTYFQIVHGLSATAAGYMEMPASVASMITSVFAGFLVSKTGRYKLLMILSFAIMAVSTVLLSLMTVDHTILVIGIYLFIFGFGAGLSFETLVLVVQNEFPISMVGTATAATNFFREIGTTLGASIMGAVFTNGLARTLTGALSDVGGVEALGVEANSITPALVKGLPDNIHDAVVYAYNDALVPIFFAMLPFMIAGLIMLLFLKENKLATRVEDSGKMTEKASAEPFKKRQKRVNHPG